MTAGGDDKTASAGDSLMVMSRLFGSAPSPTGELQTAVEKQIGKKLDIS